MFGPIPYKSGSIVTSYKRTEKVEKQKHEERIEAMRQEMKAVQDDLSVSTQRRDSILSDIDALNRAREGIAQNIAKAQVLFEAVMSGMQTELKKHKSMTTEVDKARRIVSSQKSLYASQIVSWNKKIQNAKADLERINKSIRSKHNQEKKLDNQMSAIEKRVTVAEKSVKEYDRRKVDIDAMENDLNEKIDMHGRILTRTESNLRTIEHYVKRLQRLYDKAHIKIDLLKQFNIKRDNK